MRAGEAVCFVVSSVAAQWESLFLSAGVELGSSPPPLGFEDSERRQRRVGTLKALAAAADIEVESDISGGGDSGDEAAADSSKRRGKQMKQTLRQMLASYVP
ncbi:hypothetical protein ACSSS7_007693 [Eimeria intestinalis]